MIAVPAEPRSRRVNLAVDGRHQGDPQLRAGHAEVPRGVKLKNVDLTVSLEGLAYLPRDHRAWPDEDNLNRASARSRTSTTAGSVRMVDVSEKAVDRPRGGRPRAHRDRRRRARAIRAGRMAKGDPLQAARLAGIMAAKRTSELIPLCHPLPLSHVDVTLTPTSDGYDIEARGADHRADRRRDGGAHRGLRRRAHHLRHGQGGGQGDGDRRRSG